MTEPSIAPEGDDSPDAHDEDDDSSASPRDFLLSGIGDGAPPPMIIDPQDGLPRPKDEGFVQNAVPAATEANLVCQEGGAWMPLRYGRDEDLPSVLPPDESKLRLVDIHDVDREKRVRVYAEPGSKVRWVRDRPACHHYAELETMVTEFVLEGHDKGPQTILRKCMKLDLVLTDGVLRGCNLREPRDIVSEQRLIDRAREKAAQAKEAAIAIFREARPDELRPVVDPAKATAWAFVGEVFDKVTGTHRASIRGYRASEPPTVVVGADPLYVFFPDEAWQPKAEVYHGLLYTSEVTGKPRVWSASLSGELLLRQSPGIADDERVADLTGIRKMQWEGHVQAIAKALVAGRNVAVVAYHEATSLALRAALVVAVDALGGAFERPAKKAAPKKTKKAAPKKVASPKKAAAKVSPKKKSKKPR